MLHPLETHEVLGWWTPRPFVLSAIFASLILYLRGCARLWRRVGLGHGVSGGQAAAFFAGLAVIVVAVVSPLDHLSELLFSVHMGQHELLMVVAAPLLVIGRPIAAALWGL